MQVLTQSRDKSETEQQQKKIPWGAHDIHLIQKDKSRK